MRAALRTRIVALSHPPLILDRGEAALVAQSLAALGFRYLPHEMKVRPEVVEARLGGLGTPLEVEMADRNGYGPLIRRLPADAHEDPELAQAAYLETLSPTRRDLYWESLAPSEADVVSISLENGIRVSAPTAGCVAQARARIYGNALRFLEIQNFRNQLTGRGGEVAADARVQAAAARYRTTMGEMGFEVATPTDARRRADEEFGMTRKLSDPVTASERHLALADATSQASSSINTALEESFLDVIAPWATDREEHIASLSDRLDAALGRARRALTDSVDPVGSADVSVSHVDH